MAQQEERNILQKIFKPETSKGRIRQVLVLVVLLTLGGLFIDAGKYYNQGVDWLSGQTNNVVQLPKTQAIPFNLGLDLQGGAHLVYNADMSEVPADQEQSAIQGVRDVIERRVNVFGVSEPSIRTIKTKDGNYRIMAELAGIKDVDKAIEKIGETPLLQFKEMKQGESDLSKEQRQEIEEQKKQAEREAEDVLGKVISGGDFNALEEEYDEATSTEPRWVTAQSSPQIAEVVRNLETGKVHNDLVETPEGYRIV
ncbi:MAG TPA: peptidylprolyl isomerase, partial [Patescibacteria group bacterium]|nr:peptidylprolyl isomerase [Patescibacteria group bacterium]